VKRVVSSAGQALVGFLALLLFTSLLLIVGCGGAQEEESKAPEEDEQTTTALAETTQQQATTKEASTLSPYEVIQAFENAGLEVGETYPVEQEPGWDANRVPKSYAQAARFTIPSLGVPEEGVPGPRDRGGRVFVFESQRDLDAVRGYYDALGPSALPHVYVKDQVLLLQITNDLPKAEADRYGEVLQEAA
jgi:hypothetical protein